MIMIKRVIHKNQKEKIFRGLLTAEGFSFTYSSSVSLITMHFFVSS